MHVHDGGDVDLVRLDRVDDGVREALHHATSEAALEAPVELGAFPNALERGLHGIDEPLPQASASGPVVECCRAELDPGVRIDEQVHSESSLRISLMTREEGMALTRPRFHRR